MRRITGFHRTTIMQFEWRRFSRQNRRQVEQVGNHLKVDKAQRSCDYWGITGNPRWLSPSARNLARHRGGLTLFFFFLPYTLHCYWPFNWMLRRRHDDDDSSSTRQYLLLLFLLAFYAEFAQVKEGSRRAVAMAGGCTLKKENRRRRDCC